PNLVDAFRGRLWVELVRPGASAQNEAALIDAGAKVEARPVAALSVRMAAPAGYPTFRLLCGARHGKTLAGLPAPLGVGREHHRATGAEGRARFEDQPGALANAAALAERCGSDVLPRAAGLPVKLPHGVEATAHLAAVCRQALTRKGLAGQPAVVRRL